MSYKYYQPNSKDLKDKYGDCVIRALTKAFLPKTYREYKERLKAIEQLYGNQI